jgi:hypothetical protein
MPKQLISRLSRQASETFVGREQELATLDGILGDDGPSVFYLSGIAGAGKSTLLANFAERAAISGATVHIVDCRLVEPTERGFLTEIGHLTGSEVADLDEAVAALGREHETVILGLDHYETFLLMDTWLRQDFLPALPDTFRMVIAGRQPPVPLWLTSPRWHGLFRAMAVEPLDHEASLALLERSGLDPEDAQRLASVTHGNPLALKLAASAAFAHRSMTLEDAAIHKVMQELTALNLADVEDPDTRQAVRFTSIARRITRSLLRALDLPAEEQWEELRKLPFIDTWRDGLRIHDAVREAVAITLRASDPARYLECRRKAWRQLREELKMAPTSELWRYTADMLYLIENPVVREAFFPSGRQELAIEPAQPSDFDEIHEIARFHEGPMATSIVERWWQHQPQAFRVARNREDQVVAFYNMCEARDLEPSVKADDPVAAAWCRHLREHPIPESDRALFLRRWLGKDAGEAPSPEQASCWLDVKRAYMELRPDLRRVYLTVVDLPTYAPAATQLGFEHLANSTVELDGRDYQTAVLDFGPASVDGWITRLVGDELGVAETSVLDHDQRALNLGGDPIPLTPLEFKLVEHLEGLEGSTATRDQILDEVWGSFDSAGSSNVVDAVVKSLRRKLGDEASRIETVRGFGYRWRIG